MKPTDIIIQEIPFEGENGTPCKIAILKGGFGHPDPNSFMDKAVKKYVGKAYYNEFIESNLDLPWIRIVLLGINELNMVPYTTQQLVYTAMGVTPPKETK